MKKKCCLAMVILVTVLLPGISFVSTVSAETLKVAYFHLPPHLYNTDGKHTGGAVELWEKHIGPAMGVDVVWEGPFPPSRLMHLLETGKINVIALLAKNSERALKFDYPIKPFFYGSSSIALMKDHPLNEISTMDQIAGFKVGYFNKGFRHPLVLKETGIDWVLLFTGDYQKQNVNKLLAGRLDGVYDPESSSLQFAAKTLGAADKVKILKLPGTRAGMYSLFSKKDGGIFLKKYDEVISKVLEETDYLEILKGYLN